MSCIQNVLINIYFLWKNSIFLFNVTLSSRKHLGAFTEFKNKIRISERAFPSAIDEKIGNGKMGKLMGGDSIRPMLLYTYNEKYRVTDSGLIALKFHAFKL